ncbi:p-hydroxybenzoic acid efflux pump subunit aaeB [Rhynchospora pubera]|uniref:p-hydroxybenzoic acid efflux pump subunit aaeB n=1 Tax=Rhynchospora pubera TaxID=906938 RepID=A0AAV8GRI6_9POAL|nr:p-hydroxybenzoic acid efflux pump subunit aaeB [Rhynchospora pubera]
MSQTISHSQVSPPPPSLPPPPSPVTDINESINEAPMFLTSNRTVSYWCSCMSPALRTALACIIVGVVSIHGPDTVRRHVTFPAFSYVVSIMLVGEATLGDALHGTMSAIYGTVLGIIPAMIALYFVKAVGIPIATTTATVFVMAFVVSWTRPSDSIAKRIALGQTVLIFATNFGHDEVVDQGRVRGSIMKPAHVAASTVLGVAAAILALVFPYPRLALNEVSQKKKLYIEMAMERIGVLVDGFCAENTSSMAVFISQAKSYGAASTKLLHHIKTKQEKVQWEKAPFGLSQPQTGKTGIGMTRDGLQSIEMPLKGMEIALASTNSVPIKSFSMQQDLESNLSILRDQICLKLLKPNCCHDQKLPSNKTFQNVITTLVQNPCDMSTLFFLFCMRLLLKKPLSTMPADRSKEKVAPTTIEPGSDSFSDEPNLVPRGKNKPKFSFKLPKQRIIASLKCSLALALAVLFGMLFSKDDSFWSGLTVAITFTPQRESTFTLANLRAQGTLLGSIYGVFGSYISEHLMELRFLVLLPLIIFTGFLRNSRMYGQAGSIAATLSALFLLGRRNYGSPIQFTITRLCETFIGLSCSTFVELVLQPTRASTLAKEQLCQSLTTLRECIDSMEGEKKLREQVGVLKKCITEANSEPNLWFLPFNTNYFQNLHESLSKMVDIMYFIGQGLENISLDCDGVEQSLTEEMKEMINGDIEKFKRVACASIKCLEMVCSLNNSRPHDIEIGIVEEGLSEFGSLSEIHEQFKKVEMEIMENFGMEGLSYWEIKVEIVLSVSSIGFCLGELIKEIKKMEKGVTALIQWENPGRNVNLNEIYCKLKGRKV